jgi:hypothetical protein
MLMILFIVLTFSSEGCRDPDPNLKKKKKKNFRKIFFSGNFFFQENIIFLKSLKLASETLFVVLKNGKFKLFGKNSFQKKLQTFYFKFLKYDLNENIAPL